MAIPSSKELRSKMPEAPADEGRQLLRGDGYRGIQGPVDHEDAEDALGPRCDGQRGGVGIVLSLEGDEVPGVVLHPRQPVISSTLSLSISFLIVSS